MSRAAAGVTCAAAGRLHAGGQVRVRSEAGRCYGNSLASAAPLPSLASATAPRRARYVLELGPLVSPQPWAPSRPFQAGACSRTRWRRAAPRCAGPWGGSGRCRCLSTDGSFPPAAARLAGPGLEEWLFPQVRDHFRFEAGGNETFPQRYLLSGGCRAGAGCWVGAERRGWAGPRVSHCKPRPPSLALPERRLPAPCFPSLTALQLHRCPQLPARAAIFWGQTERGGFSDRNVVAFIITSLTGGRCA